MLDASTVQAFTADVFDGPPIPLTRTRPIPEFPVESFPPAIADMIAAVAEAFQVDAAMSGTSALSALSACTGGHAEIEIRRGWREPLCLYTATIADPGERKSGVQGTMVRPILEVEAELATKGAAERLEAETQKQIALKGAEKQRNAAANADPANRNAAIADAIGAVQAAEAIVVPTVPRLVADDVTPEAAASLLAEQNGRLAIISAEGGIFDIIAGRYSRGVPNMDLWLKGHAGDPLKVDRKGREPEYIKRPALTLGLMIQRSVLAAIAGNGDFRGRGFLARILFSVPVSKVGSRKIAADPVPENVEAAYNATVRALAEQMVKWSGDPAVLTLTDRAEEAVRTIETIVEPTLAGDGELAHMADWGSKYVGAITRIAGILHLAEHGEPGVETPIRAETIVAAARVGEYFKAAAITAFSEMQTDPVTADAVYLLGRIGKLGTEFSERDLHQASRSRFKSKADMMPALQRLIENEYVAPIQATETTTGRPPSPRYVVNTNASKDSQRSEVAA